MAAAKKAAKKGGAKKGGAKKAGAAKKGAAKKAAPKKAAAAKKSSGGAAKKAAGGAKKASAGSSTGGAKKAAGGAKKAAKRTPNAAFMKELTPSAQLAAVVGEKPLARTEVVKKLWAYIKKNNLQDAKNRRAINADDKLKPVFGGKAQVSMFDMTKLVSKHLS